MVCSILNNFNCCAKKWIKLPSYQGLRYIPKCLEKDVVELSTSKTPQEPFCKQLWNVVYKEGDIRKNGINRSVEYHGLLNSFNHMLSGTGLANFKRPLWSGEYSHISVADAIAKTDLDFKNLKPLQEQMTVYRCIPKRPESLKKENVLFDKAISLKTGDKLAMREYAYCTPEKSYAQSYLNDGGIMYEMILPKGTRISQAGIDCTMPRYSQWECIDNVMEDGIHKVKLKYILPDESWKK